MLLHYVKNFGQSDYMIICSKTHTWKISFDIAANVIVNKIIFNVIMTVSFSFAVSFFLSFFPTAEQFLPRP
jgi:hypothetical protein